MTSVILGGQTLSSIDTNTLPLVGGIIIIGVCCLIPCFIGYDMVHVYERYAWTSTFFIICCLYGLGSKVGYDVNAQKSLENTGRALSADILSFGAIIFGSVAGWAPVAADYNVRLPVDTNPWHVFVLTFFGLFLPIVFTVTLGATLMTITDPVYVGALGSDGNTGALIAQVLSPWGNAGRFLLVMLSFSAMCVFLVLFESCADENKVPTTFPVHIPPLSPSKHLVVPLPWYPAFSGYFSCSLPIPLPVLPDGSISVPSLATFWPY